METVYALTWETGSLFHVTSEKCTLMIIEDGVKIPADVGGQIYLNLHDRHVLDAIQGRVLKFVRDTL